MISNSTKLFKLFALLLLLFALTAPAFAVQGTSQPDLFADGARIARYPYEVFVGYDAQGGSRFEVTQYFCCSVDELDYADVYRGGYAIHGHPIASGCAGLSRNDILIAAAENTQVYAAVQRQGTRLVYSMAVRRAQGWNLKAFSLPAIEAVHKKYGHLDECAGWDATWKEFGALGGFEYVVVVK